MSNWTPCWCGAPSKYMQPSLAETTYPMSDGMPGEYVCTAHVTKDGYEPLTPEHRFMVGDCHLLAQAIHRKTGWPMVAVVDELNPSDWWHVLVETPAGTLLDVRGEHDIDDVCTDYDNSGDGSADIREFPFPGWATRLKPHRHAYLIDDHTSETADRLIYRR